MSFRSEAPMRRTGPGSASPRSRPDTSRCYRTCMSQTSEGERRGRGGRRGRGREIRTPTCANFWPQRSTTPPSMHPCNPFTATCSCALANALTQRRLRSAASPHPKSMLDPTRITHTRVMHTGGVVDRCGQKLAHVGILISFPLPRRPLLPLLSPSLV